MRTFTVTAAFQFSKNPHPSRRAQPKPIHRSRATPVASRPPLQSERSRPMTLNVVTQSTAFEPSRVMSLLGCAKQGRKTQNNVAFCVPKRFLDRATPPVSRNWDGSESRPTHLDFAPLCHAAQYTRRRRPQRSYGRRTAGHGYSQQNAARARVQLARN